MPVAVMVKLYVPATVGVPDVMPVDGFNVTPDGSAPLLTENVIGAVAPVAVNVWLHAVPVVTFGVANVVGDTVTVPQLTVIEKACVPTHP